MHSDTHITDKLAQENQELREKLAIAEQWIGRELSEIRFRKMKEEAKKTNKTRSIGVRTRYRRTMKEIFMRLLQPPQSRE
jgi:hypothetical protein